MERAVRPTSRPRPGRPTGRLAGASGCLAAALFALTSCGGPQPVSTPTFQATFPQVITSQVPATVVPTATPSPTAGASPTPAPTATATSTPAPVLRRLTTGGCCVQPYWSPDGSQVWYIDRPSAVAPSGIWGVPSTGGEPQFITRRLGIYSPDGSLVAYPEGGQTYVERGDGSQRWTVPSGGRAVSFSPDGQWLAWQVASSSVNFDRRRVDLWVSRVDGQEARLVASLTGGGLSGWFPDSARLLVSGRSAAAAAGTNDNSQILAALTIVDGSTQTIVQAVGLRGGVLSPQGGWLVYTVSFSGDPAADGLWVARTDGSAPLRLSLFGAYRWRSEGALAVIPLEPGAEAQRLVAVDAATGEQHALTDPAVTPLHIAGGDWALNPDGRQVAYVSAEDHNIWVLELNR